MEHLIVFGNMSGNGSVLLQELLATKMVQTRRIINPPSARICLVRPGRFPSHNGGGTLDRELVIEHASIPVSFLAIRSIIAPFKLRTLQLLVGDHFLSGVLIMWLVNQNKIVM